MKPYLIAIFLSISIGLANATVNSKANPDKPSTIEITCANWSQVGEAGEATNPFCWNFNGNWSKGGGGTVENEYIQPTVEGLGHLSLDMYFLSPAGIVTNGYLFWEETDLSDPTGDDSGTNVFSADQLGGQMTFSMCRGALAEGAPGGSGWPSPYDTLPPLYENDSADCTVILHTGGKSAVNKQNLFVISGSASAITYPWVNYGDFGGRSSVPPSALQVLGKSLDTNGNLYVVLPDNADIDVTLQAPVPYYFFGVNATKYRSSFSVFVCQPDLSFPYSVWLPGINAGHAWFCLSCDASSSIVNNVIQNAVNLEYLGVQVGYGPTNTVSLWNPFTHQVGTAPGQFPWPYSRLATVQRTYTIGFADLINGLRYAESIHSNPGTYSIPNHDCVSISRDCGNIVGVTLPSDNTPEWFGFHLPPSDP